MADKTEPSRRVFLCHSSGDKPAVRALYDRLRADGLHPWLDSKDLIAGQVWDTEIRKAVKSSAVVVVFLSAGSVNKTGYVQREIRVALDAADFHPEGTIFIIPARLEKCEVPERLSHLHWVDLFEDDGYKGLLRALRARGLVDEPVARAAAAPVTTPSASAPKPAAVTTIPLPGLKDTSPRINPKDGLTYVWIPPGRFRMGCSDDDSEAFDHEEPAHDVELTQGFWLSETPVKQRGYEQVMGKNPSGFKGAERPVEQVTWEEASAYCVAVGGRLPTEAEWEYAGRGGIPAARFGDLDTIAWYYKNSNEQTQPVKGKAPNAYGLYDMLGNVLEWTADWFGPYDGAAAQDPKAPSSGTEKVLRGGGWFNSPDGVRVSSRDSGAPGVRFDGIGFRCVWEYTLP